jgi:tetratricopeptide (TPR) repeat protein
MGRKQDADTFRAKALGMANALQLYVYGRQLQGEKKQEEALAIYQSTAKKFPDYWTTHLGLARVYSAKGLCQRGEEVKLSLNGAPDANKNALETYAKRLENKDDINK